MDFNTSVSFPSFNPDLEPLNNGPRWKAYLKRFQYFLISKTELKVSEIDDEIKVGILLHHVGERVALVYDTLAEKDDKYNDIVKKLTDYFEPQVNEPFERYNFSEAKQHTDESLDNYVSRLRGLARNCNFLDLEKEIMNQVIRGCLSNELRRQGLRGSLNPSEFLKFGRSIEIANSQARSIEDKNPRTEVVSSLKKKSLNNYGSNKDNVCTRCGYSHPLNKCPAFDKVCAKCQKKNHFARMCELNSNSSYRHDHGSRYNKPGRSLKQNPRRYGNVNKIEEQNSEIEEEINNSVSKDDLIDSIFAIDSIEREELPKRDIFVTNTVVKMQIDTGASINVIVKGKEKCLLGYYASKNLGIVNIIDTIGSNSYLNRLKSDFPNIFVNKLGCQKDYEIKLDIDESVTPVFQKHRRIPFSMRAKLKQIIDQGISDRVLEVAKGPTSWMLAAMLMPKKNGKHRLVVDARPANKAIKRTQHVLSTMDDLLNDINHSNDNNSMVFSKIDLKDGYHQIKLAEDSRYITTFSTDKGIFRYKRLNMGICSAPELYHHAIQTKVLYNLKNLKNIMDDILVYGKDRLDHDENLYSVLSRLESSGMTVNSEKCYFGVDEVEFFGLTFSKKDVKLTDDKIKALKNAKSPTSVGEVHSLLGLSTYCSRYIKDHSTVVEPLRRLIKKDVKWRWTQIEEKALQKLKDSVITDCLAYFNPNWKTELIVDASPVGLGCVLMQVNPMDSSDRKVIAFASKSLNDVEKKYSQIEKEGYAAVFGCEKNHLILYGRHFTIVTDNKSLEYILNSPKLKTPARIER
ncbi:unnamed protein product, partial [Brachionus calyciflorus]